MRRALWLPGDWPTTNRALDAARADGWYAGKRSALGMRPCAPPNGDSYTHRARWGREVAAAEARRLARTWRPVGQVGVVAFLVAQTGRPDADAWSVAAKWAIDGLVDAGLLADDRRSVAWTCGRVLRTDDEARAVFASNDWTWGGWRPGLVLELAELPPGEVFPCLQTHHV